MEQKACCSASRNQHKGHVEISPRPIDFKLSKKVRHSQNLIHLSGGEFLMGTNDKEGFPADGEGPVRKVKVKPFAIDRYTVTNLEFQEFVEETGYVTESERFGWSFVFYMLLGEKQKDYILDSVKQTPWWFAVKGATWDHPEGPGSSIQERMDHPVIHVSWNDAQAYCKWSNKRLPAEAEWEYAARGGLVQNKYAWGEDLLLNGEHQCNIWQGKFPVENTKEDGYLSTAPVDAYSPNGFGLYNVAGNVWEWCSDWFSPSHPEAGILDNPTGPNSGQGKVMRGGSYLCHKSYCNRYRVAARSLNTLDSSSGNIGFRCVVDIE